MARTVDEIRQTITDAYVSNMASINIVVDATSWSVTNLQRMFIYVVAFCTYALETLFDLHATETDEKLAELKPHTLRWYANIAKAFQYGFSLITDSDQFDNTGHTDAEIEDSKIVDYAAVVEQTDANGRVSLRMKLATDNGTDLAPLSADQLTSFSSYMSRVKDAGVKLQIDSLAADSLKQTWSIYYDPLVLASDGSRIDGTSNTPVVDAIKNYLKSLPFNGIYVQQYHLDAVQAVQGVVICELEQCEAKYGALDFTQINTQYTPDAGYLRFASDADLTLTFIPQSPIK